jgi:pyruvate,water dikinase
MAVARSNVVWFEDIGRADVALVGGKSASLGEMIRTLGPKGIRVPPGFATTSDPLAFRKAISPTYGCASG